MEENIYYTELFDFYGNLLSEKQRSYFYDYYFDNLLLDEIAINDGVSKNAVSKQIKQAKNKLDYYEDKLHLLYKDKCIKKEFANEEDVLNRIYKYDIIENIEEEKK